ncbi:MAG: dethiobiotin synthase [Vicinamibacterales bacterium]
MRGVFVTGTDTNIGKTVVSAALLCRYRGAAPIKYWKPIQTGTEHSDDTAEVRRLAACSATEIVDEGFRFAPAVSPHLAAQLTGERIDIGMLTALVASQPPTDRWIVEGAGGVLVPLNESELMIDLIVGLDLPVVIVARSGLGTINHTLLTLEVLRARLVRIAGLVMVGVADAENRLAIERYGVVRVLGELPMLARLDPRPLERWARTSLDPEGRLMEFLG